MIFNLCEHCGKEIKNDKLCGCGLGLNDWITYKDMPERLHPPINLRVWIYELRTGIHLEPYQ